MLSSSVLWQRFCISKRGCDSIACSDSPRGRCFWKSQSLLHIFVLCRAHYAHTWCGKRSGRWCSGPTVLPLHLRSPALVLHCRCSLCLSPQSLSCSLWNGRSKDTLTTRVSEIFKEKFTQKWSFLLITPNVVLNPYDFHSSMKDKQTKKFNNVLVAHSPFTVIPWMHSIYTTAQKFGVSRFFVLKDIKMSIQKWYIKLIKIEIYNAKKEIK